MKDFYGRKCSKTLKKEDIDLLYKGYFFSDNSSLKKKINNFCNHFSKLNLEIGFGTGDCLIDQAQKFPEEGFIGCDPFMNGNLIIAKKIKDFSIKNIFITNVTFLGFLNSIKNIYFSKLFILFPDPWPKKRHKKRRLINKEFTDHIAQILVNNGKVIIITDHRDYQKNILISFESNARFTLVKSLKQKKLLFDNIFETKYYKKAISKNTYIHHSLYRLVEKNS